MGKIMVVFLLFSATLGLAQSGHTFDRFYVGGGGGFSIGSNQTNISIFPQVGYKITDRLSAGVGITYQYVKIKNPDANLNNFGWSLFSRYNFTPQFFGYVEYEQLKFEYFTSVFTEMTAQSSYNSLLIGGGYTESLGRNASFSFTVLYNVLYDDAEVPRPYNSPLVVRAGLNFGLFD